MKANIRTPDLRMLRRRRRRTGNPLVIALGLGYLLAGFAARAQQPKPGEYEVKAVYLYNFGRFVEWPAASGKDDSFGVCVLGQDPFGPVLDATLAGESIDRRKLVAKRITSVRDAVGCRILFVSSSEAPRLKDVLNFVNKAPVLTVSDLPEFTANGGVIQFVLQDNRVRFQVNLTAAERAGLTLSSQLLKVAVDVRREPGTSGNGDVKP